MGTRPSGPTGTIPAYSTRCAFAAATILLAVVIAIVAIGASHENRPWAKTAACSPPCLAPCVGGYYCRLTRRRVPASPIQEHSSAGGLRSHRVYHSNYRIPCALHPRSCLRTGWLVGRLLRP